MDLACLQDLGEDRELQWQGTMSAAQRSRLVEDGHQLCERCAQPAESVKGEETLLNSRWLCGRAGQGQEP